MIATAVGTYVGTRTLSAYGQTVVTYRTETREGAQRTKTGRLVHDETSYSVTMPPARVESREYQFDDVFMTETADRAFESTGPSEFATHVAWTQRTRNFFGAGRVGYAREHTFDASYRAGSVARTEREATYYVPLNNSGPAVDHSIERNDITTVIAADGSFERTRDPMMLNGYHEMQKPDGSYSFYANVPGLNFMDIRYAPVLNAGKLSGIAFHRRVRGRTVGYAPYVTTEGTTSPAWLTGTDASSPPTELMPAAFETRTITIGAPVATPQECSGRPTGETVAPSVDARHIITMSGRITDERTSSYYRAATLVCRITDVEVQTYDVITTYRTGDTSDRDVRALRNG